MPDEAIDLPADFFADPHNFYEKLRGAGLPICRIRLPNTVEGWLVVDHALARDLLRDPRLRKDARTTAGAAARSGGHHRTGVTTVNAGLTNHMLNSDPPKHTRLRRMITHAFTPAQVEALRPRISQIADELLDDLDRQGGDVDLISEYAFPLPITVICELLGIPAADRDRFKQWSNIVIDVAVADPDEMRWASNSLETYLHALVDSRKREPHDDLLSGMISADDALSDEELVSMAFLVLVAGHETTVNLIGNATLAVLSGHTSHRNAERDTTAVVEETLRYHSPVDIATLRYTAEPIHVAGTDIGEGDLILVALAAANRDPRVFHRPDEFDITRDCRGHLAFGSGIHHCVGATLARLEGQIALRKLIRRYPHVSLAPGFTPSWRRSVLIRGLNALPVNLHADKANTM